MRSTRAASIICRGMDEVSCLLRTIASCKAFGSMENWLIGSLRVKETSQKATRRVRKKGPKIDTSIIVQITWERTTLARLISQVPV